MESRAKLMRASQWLRQRFVAGSEPDKRTVKNWIDAGELRGRVDAVDKTAWIDETELSDVPDKLIKPSAWAAREYAPGSEPDPRTIKRRIETGRLGGRIIGQRAWVYACERAAVSPDINAAVQSLIAEH